MGETLCPRLSPSSLSYTFMRTAKNNSAGTKMGFAMSSLLAVPLIVEGKVIRQVSIETSAMLLLS